MIKLTVIYAKMTCVYSLEGKYDIIVKGNIIHYTLYSPRPGLFRTDPVGRDAYQFLQSLENYKS